MKLFSLSLLGLAGALSLAGCASKPDNSDADTLIFNNFDSLIGWLPAEQQSALSTQSAHSGRYSMYVDGAREYSLTYRAPLGSLSNTRMPRIRVSAWVYVPSAQVQALLVTTVGNPANGNEKPLWDSQSLNADEHYGKWVEISKVITLPDTISPTHVLTLYLWRTGGTLPVYLDDLRVSREP